ncbi:helix-turn-helix transcriptional regulator [Clostridium sp. cel8]|jgi:transcriptional regulator with XRE-family HTH domain|uniref:helix-turn-helix domain-containing protein n=1 Tax=unclassified Clostridium TaxID=2614128 RepID=UPI0015F3817C|nr:helix-turn-helix transcriptional regulator [Clostridium sp. cel8]MBA5851278.1 helix-turn-helix transcriptional regulator [Clostridium sp. cel8]
MEILSLGEKIKRKRKEMNMTLKDVAGDRITPGQISLVESGKSNPSMDLLEYLAKELNTSVEYLMESEESQAEKFCTYCENLAESYIISDNLIRAKEYIEKAFYYADKYNLEYKKAKNLYLRGKICMIKEEYSESQQFFLSANVIFIKNNNYEEIIKCFMNLGYATIKLKSYNSAMSYFRQAEIVYNNNNIGDDLLIGKIYYYIAFVYFELDDMKNAMDYSYLAKEKFMKVEDNNKYAKTLLLIAEEYNKKGDFDNAIKYSKKTLDVYKSIADIVNIAKIENNMGNLFSKFDNMEESFLHLNKSKELRNKIKDPDIIYTLKSICENYMKIKDIKGARDTLKEMFSIVGSKNDTGLIQYYLLKYRVDMMENNIKEAENTLFAALNYCQNMDYTEYVGKISILIGKFYIQIGNEAEAAKYLSKGVDMFNELNVLD